MFEPGTQVGRYEIQRRLGRGGMGAVYVAHDPVLGRMVAIKVFAGDLDLPDARERFSREARAAAALSHPNIVTIYDFGEYDSQPFIVMEYVAGETLAAFIRRKTPVTMADKVRWMEELCAGAGYAHQMQLVHRDIKPANLMIDRSGRLKILDFGIARILGLASNTAVMIGTPGYMAPEQITGDPVDHRADQFSIGVVFYELLTGTEAFPGDTLPTITHRILNEEPVPLGRLAPDAPAELIAIIQQTLRKNPADRFADTETLRAVVARVRRDTSNQGWNVNAIAATRETPSPPPMAGRGTGSARRRQDDAVGVAQLTPPPDPKRTDREALARRRTMQLEAALQEARRRLAQGQLESALDACQQALTFDENHLGALRLEEEIETSLRQHAMTQPEASLASSASVETWWPGVGGRPSEVVTRLDQVAPTGTPPAPSSGPERTVLRAPTAPDATVIAPPRKTPPPVLPPAAPPVPPQASNQSAAKAPTDKEWRRTSVAALHAVVAVVPRDRRTLSIVAIGVGVVVAAVIGFTLMSGPAPTGSVVIDAAPWGSITAIEPESGSPVTLPSSASTPFSVTLPTGTYRVVVVGPPPESQTERITVQVEKGVSTVVPLIRFRALTPEEYFEEYLSAPTAPTSEPGLTPAELVPATPTQPSPVTTPAGPTQSSPVSTPASVSNP
jgi:eukaryotic-like serine/threonine-protein kinase